MTEHRVELTFPRRLRSEVVDALRAAGATVLVHDPMYNDDELAKFGWDAYHLGEDVDAAIVQADHAQYREMTPADLPGIKVLFDGRRATDPAKWEGITRMVIGDANA